MSLTGAILESFLKIENLELFFRITLSAIFGFLIGLERIIRNKPAGIKTYSFVCVASTLLTIISIYSVTIYSNPGHTMMDPMRLAAQIVSGLGFLGAGLIIHKGFSVKGLTSSAMILFSGAIGIGIGAGFYAITTYTMILMFIILRIGSMVEKHPKFKLIRNYTNADDTKNETKKNPDASP